MGRNVARIAKGFGMEVYAYDAFCPASVIEADGVKAVASTADLFKACQIVSLHIPATAETKGSINFELMNSMPKGAIVVNTARKEVMDEAGLAKMLEERPDFKYLTDICRYPANGRKCRLVISAPRKRGCPDRRG